MLMPCARGHKRTCPAMHHVGWCARRSGVSNTLSFENDLLSVGVSLLGAMRYQEGGAHSATCNDAEHWKREKTKRGNPHITSLCWIAGVARLSLAGEGEEMWRAKRRVTRLVMPIVQGYRTLEPRRGPLRSGSPWVSPSLDSTCAVSPATGHLPRQGCWTRQQPASVPRELVEPKPSLFGDGRMGLLSHSANTATKITNIFEMF